MLLLFLFLINCGVEKNNLAKESVIKPTSNLESKALKAKKAKKPVQQKPNFEAVFERAKDAQLWLSPSYYTSYDALRQSNSHYTQFDAFKNRHIFTFSNTTGTSGGVIYYELGTARPDLVLKDMIKICHPDLLKNYETTFFKPLD